MIAELLTLVKAISTFLSAHCFLGQRIRGSTN